MLSWLTVFLLPLVECSFPGGPSAPALGPELSLSRSLGRGGGRAGGAQGPRGHGSQQLAELQVHWSEPRPILVLRNFGSWSYEGGAITRGLWEILAAFPDTGRGVILLLYS